MCECVRVCECEGGVYERVCVREGCMSVCECEFESEGVCERGVSESAPVC